MGGGGRGSNVKVPPEFVRELLKGDVKPVIDEGVVRRIVELVKSKARLPTDLIFAGLIYIRAGEELIIEGLVEAFRRAAVKVPGGGGAVDKGKVAQEAG